MKRNIRQAASPEDPPEGANPLASRTFRSAQLKLLMKEREDVISRLVGLDYSVWALEEFFRAGGKEEDLLPPPGTVVPKGSLSSEGGKRRP